MKSRVTIGTVETPFGVFGAAFSEKGLGRLTFPDEPLAECSAWARRWYPDSVPGEGSALPAQLAAELNAYLAGRLTAFSLPLDMQGTPFQQAVWQALLAIPYGETRSYGETAVAVERPKAVRAVGAAIGANPVPVIVPCHRVIGQNGRLVGFGGGLDLKRRLLDIEGASYRG